MSHGDDTKDGQSVFVSHSAGNVGAARKVAESLAGAGYDVWFDEWKVAPGDDFREAIDKAIQEADAFVVLTGEAPSSWGRHELSEMLERSWEREDLPIVPVVVAGDQPPAALRTRRAIRLDPESGAGLEDVIEALRDPRAPIATEADWREFSDRLRRVVEVAATLPESLPPERS